MTRPSVIRLVGVGLAVLAVGPAAWATEASVFVEDNWYAAFSGDTIDYAPAIWGRSYGSMYNVSVGTVSQPSLRTTLPDGFDEVWADAPAQVDWHGGTSTLTLSRLDPLSGFTYAAADHPQVSASQMPAVSVTRSIPGPILMGDVTWQAVVLDVTIEQSLAGQDFVNVEIAGPWSQVEGLEYLVAPAGAPAGFSAAWEPGVWAADDPAALVVGQTYQFAAVVEVTRTGEMSQSQMGTIWHQVPAAVRYGVQGPVGPVTAAEIGVPVAPGVETTFRAEAPTDFTGTSADNRSLAFSPVVATFGPATPTQFWIGRSRRTSISGLVVHGFGLDVEGDNITHGTVETPGGRTYDLEYEDLGMWEFGHSTTDPLDLEDFGPGTYTIHLRGSDGVTRDYALDLPDDDPPVEMPGLVQTPADHDTTERRPTLGWLAPTDPAVTDVFVELWTLDDEFESEAFLDKTETTYTPAEDLPFGACFWTPWYTKHTEGTTPEGVPFTADLETGTDDYFNVLPGGFIWTGLNTHWEIGDNWAGDETPTWLVTALLDTPAAVPPTLYADQEVRRLDFRTPGWTLGDSGGRTLSVGPGGIESAGAGVNTVVPAVRMTASSTWTIGADNTLVLNGELRGGGYALTKNGAGALRVAGVDQLGSLWLEEGLFGLLPDGMHTLLVPDLSITTPAGMLDLANNNLAVDYPDGGPNPLAAITDWLKSGQNIEAGYWDGPGIHSSTAAGDPTGLTTLGVLDNAEYGWPDLEGTPVDESCVLVKYTYYGDADLDGSTTGDDYFLWLAGFDAARDALAHGGEPTLSGWLYGDFDYSGDVTGDDYFLWLVAFDAARSGATPLSGGAAAAIPEPVSLSLLALGAALVGWQRRRTVPAP